MASIRSWLALACFIAAAACQAGELPQPAFPPHPRLEYSAAEISAWKGDAARSQEIKGILSAADKILASGIKVPEKNAQWCFYYACPKDASFLNEIEEGKHQCPACKAIYTDERIQAAARCRKHDEVNTKCHSLALAYALSGDEKYAQAAKAPLLELAKLYPDWEHHDRWGRTGLLAVVGGWRYSQLLDEATSLIVLAKSYDLIADAPCISAGERDTIEQKLLAYVAGQLQSYQKFIEAINNHRTWFNGAYAATAVALGDEKLLRDAIEGNGGLLWQLDHSVTRDGIWYEGTMAYHFYALSAIEEAAKAAKRAGWDFASNARLRSLWFGPIKMAYPNGQFPVIHDSDPASLDGYASHYAWAYSYFNEQIFALYGKLKIANLPERLRPASDPMPGIGVASLRQGKEGAEACAMIDYGIHGGHHGHPDKLNLLLFANGTEFIFDPGRISYSVPEYESWCRTTAAHNTLVIHGKNQKPDEGKLLFFAETEKYTACLAQSKGAYPGWNLKRFIVLTPDYLADVYSAEGEKKAKLDWVLHCRGALATSSPLTPATAPLGNDNGYQHLSKISSLPQANNSCFTANQGNSKTLRICLAGDEESKLYTGMGIGYNLKDSQPFIMRRRVAEKAVFAAAYGFTGSAGSTFSLEIEKQPEAGVVILKISAASGVQRLTLNLADEVDDKKRVSFEGTSK